MVCGGPDVLFLPLPIPDPSRPWGASDCPDCGGSCYGHFLKPDAAMTALLPRMRKPPSVAIREIFQRFTNWPPSEQQLRETAKAVLLPPQEVEMWFDHLKTIKENRKRGALRAAETRRKKKNKMAQTVHDVYYCGVCHDQYVEYTDQEEMWIGCESCSAWFHFDCVGITAGAVPEEFFCENCKDNQLQ